MIKVQIEPDAAQGYVLRVRDGNNDNILLSSTTQSYANAGFAQELARRLFPLVDVGPVDDAGNDIESVVMVTRFRSGEQQTETLR